MTQRLVRGLLAVALLAGVGIALSRSVRIQDPLEPDGPLASRVPAGPARTATLMLTVQLDANGVHVLQATRKPDLEWVARRNDAQLVRRWTMRDAVGAVIATGGFDPARICLDPAHVGRGPHMEGDVTIPHVDHTNLKVPDLPAFDRLEFTRLVDGVEQPFGVASKRALTLR